MNDLLQLNIKPQAKAQKCKLKPETSDAAQEDPPKGFRLWGGLCDGPTRGSSESFETAEIKL